MRQWRRIEEESIACLSVGTLEASLYSWQSQWLRGPFQHDQCCGMHARISCTSPDSNPPKSARNPLSVAMTQPRSRPPDSMHWTIGRAFSAKGAAVEKSNRARVLRRRQRVFPLLRPESLGRILAPCEETVVDNGVLSFAKKPAEREISYAVESDSCQRQCESNRVRRRLHSRYKSGGIVNIPRDRLTGAVRSRLF